jgi:hypothetical protein
MRTASMRPGVRLDGRRLVALLTGGLLTQALILALIVKGLSWIVFASLGLLAVYWVIVKRWRRGIYALILYLPFAGLPSIVLYPAPPITALLKDVLFVIPTYIGFVLWRASRHRGPIVFAGAPIGLLGAFVALALLEMMNPALVSPLVGLIGLKVRLFYIPLYFIGYHLLDSRDRLFSISKTLLAVGMVPAMVGLIQAALVYSGHAQIAYAWYGAAAQAVTQNYAQLAITPDVALSRIPSTFTFNTQYWTFLFALLPIAYAMVVPTVRVQHAHRRRYTLALAVIVLAALTSGARAAFALVPIFFVIAAILEGKVRRLWKPLASVSVGFVLLAGLMGIAPGSLIGYAGAITGHYASSEGLFAELGRALSLTWLGLGPGTSTGPARFAFAADAADTGLVGLEGFYPVIVAELGVVGLIVVVMLFAAILAAGYRRLVRLHDRVLRAFAAGFLSFLAVIVVYLLKGALLDYDALNVYFWLYAGMLMKLPMLQTDDRLPQATFVAGVDPRSWSAARVG